MLPGVQDTKAKETDEAAGKLLEVPPIELVLDLKALTTSQWEILLRGKNKRSAAKGNGMAKFTALFYDNDAAFIGI